MKAELKEFMDASVSSCACGCCGHEHEGAHEHEEHAHGHSHEHEELSASVRLVKWITAGIGVVAYATALFAPLPDPYPLLLFAAAYLLIGWTVLLGAIRNISHGQIFDENFLMAIASLGAFAIGEYPEGVAVMLFYQIGETFQDMATDRARDSIASLMDIRPDFANLKTESGLRKVPPEDVDVGALIVVKAGEKIPLDGVVTEGEAALDTVALTGESLPRDVGPGSEVLSGSINTNGLLTVRVTKAYGESTVARILALVESASEHKAPVENFITKFARYYTPAVCGVAAALALIPPLILPDAHFADWIQRALVFLVVSCPCALVISIPLSFFGGIGAASRRGILVKGGNYLEALNSVDMVVFDKTGTLTKGVFKVQRLLPADGVSEAELLQAAAYAEHFSNHPIARSVASAYARDVDEGLLSDFEELSGRGVRVKCGDLTLAAGNGRLMQELGVTFGETHEAGSVLYIAAGGKYLGALVIADELKEDSAQAMRDLAALGVQQTVMLTGDTPQAAEVVAAQVGVSAFRAGLLPQQKVEEVDRLIKSLPEKRRLVFVGDGINDAPVLARADVGIAMGGVGSDAAIEAADVVLMTDEPAKVAEAIRVARKTQRVVMQNIVFALGVKGIILLLGALGLANMWEAVFGDVGVALIAIANAMRVK
jgi:Cd2+/Zn2+-exporting ATPase